MAFGMSYLALAVTALLAVLLWKIVKWMTKRKSIEKQSHGDNKRPESIEISSASSLPGNKYGTPNPEELQLSDQNNSKTKSTEQEQQMYARLSTSAASSSEAKAAEIQKELRREIRRRENAEDWAEFLTLELEAHIQAYVKAEQRYKQLFVKLDPASQEILKENTNEVSIRTFKNFNEAQIVWAEFQSNEDNSRSENTRKFSQDEQDKEAELNEIVETNLQFLQAANHHATVYKTASKKKNSRLQRSRCGLGLNGITAVSNPVNIVIEECVSPEKLTVQEDEEQTEDSCKLGLQNLVG